MKKFAVDTVSTAYGMTISLGNFEFFRADIDIEFKALEQPKTEQEAEQLERDMCEYGWGVCREQLYSKIRDVRAKSGNKKGGTDG